MIADTLTHETAQKVLLADLANILRKAKSGKPLTKYERALIEGAAGAQATKNEEREADQTPAAIEDDPAPNTGTKFAPIRWTLERASSEFDINPRTLSKRLKATGTEPGKDGKFSTSQIAGAKFSDYDNERTRLTKAQADQAELDLSVSRREVVPVAIAFQCVSNMLFAVRRVIEMSELPNDRKDAIFNELQSMKPDDFITEAKFEENAQ
jgi:AraC-like DNA-binding protein